MALAVAVALTGCKDAKVEPVGQSSPSAEATRTDAAPGPSPDAATSAPSAPTSAGAPTPRPAGASAGAGIGGPNWSATQLPPTQGGRHLYVSGRGRDSNNGLSRATPVRTLQRAADMTRPGDTVLVGDGEYTSPENWNVLNITRPGTPDRWITYAAYPGERPVVRPMRKNWQGIHVGAGAAYIRVVGFTVKGQRANLTPEQIRKAQRGDGSDPAISANCIAVDVQKNQRPMVRPHHVVIWGNTATDCPLVGISAQFADHVTVENNVTAFNGFYSPYGGSGISFHGSWNSDAGTGHKMIIRGNVSYGNKMLVKCICVDLKAVTDGNGIIVDSTNNKSFAAPPLSQAPYAGRTLVENNITYDNGGRGINVFQSLHVDVVNNTLYRNATHPAIDSDLGVVRAEDVTVANNIVVAGRGEKAVGTGDSRNVRFDSNLVVGPYQGPRDARLLTGDPGFRDPAAGDFRLTRGSPAIDSGTGALAPKIDATRSARAGRVDRGALDHR
ncbi:right-handed parallel beta-helix repeat-containing protein [Micromonospora psammae]|uniref:right-handed parallel beta-helix repeat-containing protein n=1 Tax=Micromonospora sp. CPCC 205556 TaxID=3122398 RepID=UPI002FF1CEEE